MTFQELHTAIKKRPDQRIQISTGEIVNSTHEVADIQKERVDYYYQIYCKINEPMKSFKRILEKINEKQKENYEENKRAITIQRDEHIAPGNGEFKHSNRQILF